MRTLSVLLVLVAAAVLSSCLTIEERISFNPDGSGTVLTTIDLGAMLSNPFMKGALEEEMNKEVGNPRMRIDSLIDIYTPLAEANPQWTATEKALVRTVESRMVLDMEAGEGGVYVTYPFKNVGEFQQIMTLMSQANAPANGEEGNPLSGLTSGNGINNTLSTFTWKKGLVGRTTTVPDDLLTKLGIDQEMMGMVEMMFSEASIRYVMEFPGTVKKVKGFPGHRIEDGNTVVQEYNFLEMLKSADKVDEGLDGSVKYK